LHLQADDYLPSCQAPYILFRIYTDPHPTITAATTAQPHHPKTLPPVLQIQSIHPHTTAHHPYQSNPMIPHGLTTPPKATKKQTPHQHKYPILNLKKEQYVQ
jgi:hypothetical protein